MQTKKIALITGGTGDIGTAIVKQLSQSCSAVIALDITAEAQAEQWLANLNEQHYNNVHFRSLDVSSYEECEKTIGKIIKDFERIDILINNAGITRDAVFTKMTPTQWNDVLRVNLDSMFNVSRQVVETMRNQEFGRIVNISSVNAQRGQFSQANYAAAKAGIYGFTKSLAQELIAKQITVNSISPGYVNTRLMKGIRPDILASIIEQIPAKRLAEPEEIAWIVEFLVSDKNNYMTGANLSVNGGLHMY